MTGVKQIIADLRAAHHGFQRGLMRPSSMSDIDSWASRYGSAWRHVRFFVERYPHFQSGRTVNPVAFGEYVEAFEANVRSIKAAKRSHQSRLKASQLDLFGAVE